MGPNGKPILSAACQTCFNSPSVTGDFWRGSLDASAGRDSNNFVFKTPIEKLAGDAVNPVRHDGRARCHDLVQHVPHVFTRDAADGAAGPSGDDMYAH
jgi:hypothetical protein